MNRNTRFMLGLGMVVIGGGFFITRSIQRKKLFAEISGAIGYQGSNIDNYDKYFNPNYWSDETGKPETYKLEDYSKLVEWADDLQGAFSYTNDDEEEIYGVLRQIPDGVALSQVADVYQDRHNEDLKEEIKGLDDDEVKKVADILSQYAPYRQVI